MECYSVEDLRHYFLQGNYQSPKRPSMSRCSGMRRRSRQRAVYSVCRRPQRHYLVLVARTKRRPKRDEQGLRTRGRGTHGLESRVRGIGAAIGYVLYAELLIRVVGIEVRVHRAAVSRDRRNRPVGCDGRIDRKLIRNRTVHQSLNAGRVDGHGTVQIGVSGKLSSY